METHVFDYNDSFGTPAGDLLRQFFALRKKTFIDGLGWSLETTGDLETDQYDNPNCTYLIVCKRGLVVAGARIIPADKSWYGWTNLMKDSTLGRCPAIDADLFPPEFDFTGSYECSRLVVDHAALTSAEVSEAFDHLGRAFRDVAMARNLRTYLSLSPPALRRKFCAMGFQVSAIGKRYICPDDGRRYQVLRLDNAPAAQVAA